MKKFLKVMSIITMIIGFLMLSAEENSGNIFLQVLINFGGLFVAIFGIGIYCIAENIGKLYPNRKAFDKRSSKYKKLL